MTDVTSRTADSERTVTAAADVAPPAASVGGVEQGEAGMREFLVGYHQALGSLQALASTLLDLSQADAGPMTDEQARTCRRTAGQALETVRRGEVLLQALWQSFGVDRRLAPAGAPLPLAVRRDRRHRRGKGAA